MPRTIGKLSLALFLLGMAAGLAPAAEIDLQAGFARPPAWSRPWVYWFWLNGNITRDGITADLEAMQRAGIGGVLIMEVDQGAPAGEVAYGSDAWRDLFGHVLREAHRLDLQVNLNNDAGWCGSGGPWVPARLAMQKVVWSETEVRGPGHITLDLAQPPAVADFYRDIAVLAIPRDESSLCLPGLAVKAVFKPVSSSLPCAVVGVSGGAGVVARPRVVDISDRMSPAGRLEWDAPPGEWSVLRFGHTPTGAHNLPAPESGRGLECDKLNPEAARVAFDGLIAKLCADSPEMVGQDKTLVATHIDSWEVGVQNWTPGFRGEFARRRGYDMTPFLPVLTGRVVDSLETSERFLWDFRQTISEMLLDNYAGAFARLAHQRGLRLSVEAYNTCPTNELAYAGRADEPMGEFWSWGKYGAAFSCTEMASAGHVYGKRIIGAEAFTASSGERWLGHPGNIKDLGDWAFCEGINRFVFHRYALQPWRDRAPGMSMGPWGLHYERTQTWWEMSRPWHEYLARCQYLLQQGLFVADICLLTPEGSPQSLVGQALLSGAGGRPRERPGHNFDLCPPEVVLERMSVADGKLVLPDGMSYLALALPRAETMTPELLGKLQDLAEDGATLIGAPPLKSPSLSGYPDCDADVAAIARAMWGGTEAPSEVTVRPYGKGRVVWGGPFALPRGAAALARQAVLPPSLSAARWIWTPEAKRGSSLPPGERIFRRRFSLAADVRVRSARLVMTADNAFECRLNDRRALTGEEWSHTYSAEITGLLTPGENVILVRAANTTDAPSPAGLIGAVAIRFADGGEERIVTDARWQSASDDRSGWQGVLDLGPLGMEPWGDVETPASDTNLYPDLDAVGRVLDALGVPADFAYRPRTAPGGVRTIHRRLDGADAYFVANQEDRPVRLTCAFRVGGRRPELWQPESGRVETCAIYDTDGLRTIVPLALPPYGSVFVVFPDAAPVEPERIVSVALDGEPVLDCRCRERPPAAHFRDDNGSSRDAVKKKVLRPAPLPPPPADGREARLPRIVRTAAGGLAAEGRAGVQLELQGAGGRRVECRLPAPPAPLPLEGPWEVRFPPGHGAPATVELERLISWTEHPDAAVRYFSGVATYRLAFALPAAYVGPGRRLTLDLGRVAVVAGVRVNDRDVAPLWKAPFRVDVTEAVHVGENLLEVRVANLWVNRLIGDEQLPEDSERTPGGTLREWPDWLLAGRPSPTGRFTFTSWRLWHKADNLVDSGLLGPVRLIPAVRSALPWTF